MTTRIANKNLFSALRSLFQPKPKSSEPKGFTPPNLKKILDSFDPAKIVSSLIPRDGDRSVLDALSQGKELLEGPATEKKTDQGAVITADPANVNLRDDTNEKSTRHIEADKQLAANAGLEKLLLERLGATERTQYETLKGQLEKDPVAQLSLQMLLFSGKLTSKKALGSGENVLQGLAKLSEQKLAEGLDRNQLLGDLVQELACPATINQRDRGTCAATVVAIDLLLTNPAEYVRLVAGLATPEGTVKLASGKSAAREPGTASEDGTNRSVSQRLLAPAFMEIANGTLDYDNKDDVHLDGTKEKGSGLTARQVDVLLEEVFGQDYAFSANIDGASEREKNAAFELIRDDIKDGGCVPVGLIWGETTSGPGGTVVHTGHKVLVTDLKQRDGQEYVVYINPWGRTEEMPKDEFLGRLRNVNYLPQ